MSGDTWDQPTARKIKDDWEESSEEESPAILAPSTQEQSTQPVNTLPGMKFFKKKKTHGNNLFDPLPEAPKENQPIRILRRKKPANPSANQEAKPEAPRLTYEERKKRYEQRKLELEKEEEERKKQRQEEMFEQSRNSKLNPNAKSFYPTRKKGSRGRRR